MLCRRTMTSPGLRGDEERIMLNRRTRTITGAISKTPLPRRQPTAVASALGTRPASFTRELVVGGVCGPPYV